MILHVFAVRVSIRLGRRGPAALSCGSISAISAAPGGPSFRKVTAGLVLGSSLTSLGRRRRLARIYKKKSGFFLTRKYKVSLMIGEQARHRAGLVAPDPVISIDQLERAGLKLGEKKQTRERM